MARAPSTPLTGRAYPTYGKKVQRMKCCKKTVSLPTVASLAFALGVLLTRFLPPAALTVLLAAAILAAGVLALLRK